MNQILSILVPLPDGYHHVDSIHISRMNENKYFPRVPRTAWIHLPGSLQTNTLKIRVNSYRDSCGKCLFLYFLSEILPTRGGGGRGFSYELVKMLIYSICYIIPHHITVGYLWWSFLLAPSSWDFLEIKEHCFNHQGTQHLHFY